MPSRNRVALVLVDGIGDVSLPSLGYKTPLEAADIPNLDALAAAGVNGLMDPVETGLACGSDTAHLSLLGYNPRVYYRGRGAFESMGAGLPMAPGDIAFKSNFATVDDATGIVTSRRADRHFEELGPVLCTALNGCQLPNFPHYQVNVRYATEHRCGVVVRGPGLSGNISGTDPLKDNLPLRVAQGLDGTPEADHTARVVMEVSDTFRAILRQHPINAQRIAEGKNPANVVLLRGCGIRIQVPTLQELHGVVPCMVAPTKIIAGLGLSLGMDILEAPGATGDYRTQLTSKAAAIAAALSAPRSQVPRVQVPGVEGSQLSDKEGGYDFGFLHIKAVDDAGHDKAGRLKVRLLEAVDRMVGQLARRLWEAEREGVARYTLMVTGDHSTPVEYGDHSYEPVPLVACQLADFVERRGEAVVASADLAPFPLPQVEAEGVLDNGSNRDIGHGEAQNGPSSGDGVVTFSELAAARGTLGRFPGSYLMSIVKHCLQQPQEA